MTGCSGKKSEADIGEGNGNEITKESKENKDDEKPENSNIPVSDNVYDGINRVTITFHGDSSTQVGLSWYTPSTEDGLYGNDVVIIEKTTMKKIEAEYEIETGKAENDEESMYHQTVIKGLKPGTEYYFRVGDEACKQWSEYGSFKTSSKDMDSFKFVAVTDTQSEHLPDAYYSAATMKKALETAGNPVFIMHSGDFVDISNEENMWLSVMNASKSILMNNIIAPAVGNHDEAPNTYWQHFKVEHTNDHKTGGTYYSYDYGNVHFVVLNTNKVNDEDTSYIDDEQLLWLDEDLKAANENGAKWIIVNMHRGLYTVGKHADNDKFAGEKGARKRVGEIFEKYGVSLVFQGHDHCPSVTKPLKEGKISENGVVYVTTGAAGSKTYEADKSIMPEEYYELFSYMGEGERSKDTYQNFAVIEVTNQKINVKLYEMNLLKNENNLYIINEFEINK